LVHAWEAKQPAVNVMVNVAAVGIDPGESSIGARGRDETE